MRLNKKINNGFTLIEVLIALFIFTIISVIMVSALHMVITTQGSLEKNTARFDQLQLTLVLMQRDLEQIIDRPITATNAQEPSVSGTSTDIKFTHAGFANPLGTLTRSTLQRTQYYLQKNTIIRQTWPSLDRTHDTVASERKLLDEVTDLRFEYLDQSGKFQNHWPTENQQTANQQPGTNLPHAIRVTITLKKMGRISQLYVIPGKTIDTQK